MKAKKAEIFFSKGLSVPLLSHLFHLSPFFHLPQTFLTGNTASGTPLMLCFKRGFSILLMLFVLSVQSLPVYAAEAAPVVEFPAAPESVTLYPDGARLSVSQTLAVVDGAVQLLLPAGVRPDSVTLTIEGRSVRSVMLSPVAVPDSAKMRQLRKQYEAARDAVFADEGALASFKARRELWTKPEMRMTQAAEVERLDRLISERLSSLYLDEGRLEAQLDQDRAERDRLRQAVEEAGGLAPTGLLLRAELAPAGQNSPRALRASLSYSLSACAWRPMYRVEADPAKHTVTVVQEAEIRQSSGVDWNKVRLTLATADPGSGLEPAPIAAWHIRPRPKAQARAMMSQSSAKTVDNMLMAAAPAMESDAMPMREQESFSSWELGVRDVPAGTPQRLTLQQDVWPAVFSRVARPARDPRVYLSAKINLAHSLALPSGMATWSVEGETVGSGPFSFVGDKADLFFGVDPRVITEMKLDTRQSGRSGFVDRKQTRVWNWAIEVRNAHSQAVNVRIEDAEPRSGDQGITIETISTPPSERKDHQYIWNLDVPANGKTVIQHKISVSAPDDMLLDDGR